MVLHAETRSALMRPMRAILTIACASVAFAAGAQAQDALRSCRQIRDDGERLKCYDRLDASSSSRTGRPGESKPGAGTAWIVNDEKSPLDDSPLVSAALESSDGKAHLLMRCKDRKTELAVSIRGFIKCGTDIPVTYPAHSRVRGSGQNLFPHVRSSQRRVRRIIQSRQGFRDPFPLGGGLRLGGHG